MVLSAASRRLTVTYGGFTLDDANGITLQGLGRRYTLRETHNEGYFAIEFVVRLTSPSGVEATDDASFRSLCNAVETNLRKRRAKLTVALNGSTINGNGSGWDPTSTVRSAFLIEAECEKIGSTSDNARRRTYRFSVRCQFPAESGQNYRRDSATQTTTGVNGRRICTITGAWTGAASKTAATIYSENGDSFFSGQLPTPVTNGEWVLVNEDPSYDDENVVLRVTRIYWEVVNGLREYAADISTAPNGARQVVISGFYMETSVATALTNYTNNVAGLVSTILTAEGGASLYDAVAIPKVRGFDTTGKIYRFSHTYREIVYQQGTSTDDPNVTSYTLDVAKDVNFSRQAIARSVPVSRLQRAFASYTAVIDKTSSGGTDPHSIWTSRQRAYVVNAITTKLGSLSVIVEDERVSVGLDGNTLNVQMALLVRGGDVLSLSLEEEVSETPAGDLTPMADGNAFSYWLDKLPPTKTLRRTAVIEHISGINQPKLWARGEDASGFKFQDTQRSMEDALEMLKQGSKPQAPGWFPRGFSVKNIPGSQGESDQLSTVFHVRVEQWQWVQSWAAQKQATGGDPSVQPSGGRTVSR